MCLLCCRLLLIDIFILPTPVSVHSVTLTRISKYSQANQVTQKCISLYLFGTNATILLKIPKYNYTEEASFAFQYFEN